MRRACVEFRTCNALHKSLVRQVGFSSQGSQEAQLQAAVQEKSHAIFPLSYLIAFNSSLCRTTEGGMIFSLVLQDRHTHTFPCRSTVVTKTSIVLHAPSSARCIGCSHPAGLPLWYAGTRPALNINCVMEIRQQLFA
jgi:hypothetical protein